MKLKEIIRFPPTLEDCETPDQKIDWLRNRVYELEKECDAYRKDGMYALYWSHNRKAVEISESLNSFVLSLANDNKTLERYALLIKVQPEQLKILDALRKEYLKTDEETLEQIKINGVPLIERRAVKEVNKKK